MILINVDLPAPFSPTSACTSPARNSNDTPFSACTPPNDLLRPLARSNIVIHHSPLTSASPAFLAHTPPPLPTTPAQLAHSPADSNSPTPRPLAASSLPPRSPACA